jgi:hypothetical protein
MEKHSLEHPDVEQKQCEGRRKRRISGQVGRVLRNRRTFITALWVATVIIKVWKLIRDIFHDS